MISRDKYETRLRGNHVQTNRTFGAASRSRGATPELCIDHVPPKSRGRREKRVPAAPAAPCASRMHRDRDHRCRRINRPSLRNGFNGVLRALLGDRAFLPPSICGSSRLNARSGSARHPQTLAPASGRQDHATSPSAIASLVRRAAIAHGLPRPAIRTRAHDALASTAFRPNVRDDAYAPLIGPGCEDETIDLGGRRSELFFAEDLDDPNQVESVEKIRLSTHGIFQVMRRSCEAMLVGICPSGESKRGTTDATMRYRIDVRCSD